MKSEDRDKELLERVKGTLDESCASLDGETLHRLRGIRLAALDKAPADRRPFFLWRGFTAGGFATAAVLVVAVSLWMSTFRAPLPEKQVEDLEIITSQEHIDLYEDLEFYKWLAEG
jgi:hypothetical protein